MTWTDRTFMGKETQDTGTLVCLKRTITAALRRERPLHTAKCIARELGCTPKAAANLLDGHLSTPMMGRLIAAYGAGWVAERVLEAAGYTLESYIRTQAEQARATALRHEENARELDRLETALAASRRPQPESHLGRLP